MASSPPLSEEQRRAVEHAGRGTSLAVVARAGSGKTHTLRAIAEAAAGRRTLLLAFNRSVAQDARTRLPRRARATTVHALAYRAVVAGDRRMRDKLRSAASASPRSWQEAAGLEPADPASAAHLAAIRAILERFLRDDATAPAPGHVPAELAEALASELGSVRWDERRRWLVRRAERLWRRIADPDDPLPLSHDAYLKLFAQRVGPLPSELLLVDEAQDLAPVTLAWLHRQEAQVVLVGDPAQRIYGWRGAVDAMAASGHPEVALTRSFRFGTEIATVARSVLRLLAPGSDLVGVGGPGRVVVGEPIEDGKEEHDAAAPPRPRAVLCRGNGGVLEAVVAHAEVGVSVVGGFDATIAELGTAHALWRQRRARHASAASLTLHGCSSWQQFERAADLQGGTLRTLRNVVERYGDELPARLARARTAIRARPEAAAVTVSTIHRAKGREWDHVELWHDLARIPADPAGLAGAPDPERARAEANLLYVAVTRARRSLWLHRVARDLKAVLVPGGLGD